MSRFALDLLFMHGHFVSPAALVASGLLEEQRPELPSASAAKPEPQHEAEPERGHGDGDRRLAA